MIREVVLDRRMPPWHADPHGNFANDRSLTGARGPRAHCAGSTRAARRPATANRIPSPRPPPPPPNGPSANPTSSPASPASRIPATGMVDYRYVDADFEMPQDAWLRAAVTRPGNAENRTPHHRPPPKFPTASAAGPGESYLFTTWVPGLASDECPPDTGALRPQGRERSTSRSTTPPPASPRPTHTAVGLYLAKTLPKLKLETRASETRAARHPPRRRRRPAHHGLRLQARRDPLRARPPHAHPRRPTSASTS